MGAGLSIRQAIKAEDAKNKADKAAQRAIADLKKLKYTDTFADVQVPTLGAELEFEQQQLALKTGLTAAAEAGPSGVHGIATKLEGRQQQTLLPHNRQGLQAPLVALGYWQEWHRRRKGCIQKKGLQGRLQGRRDGPAKEKATLTQYNYGIILRIRKKRSNTNRLEQGRWGYC